MDPVVGKDIIGISGIGVQSSHRSSYGEKWQMAIAVPLNNRRFDYGTILNLTLAGDSFNKSNINQNETQFGITAISKNINSLPSNFIQYGDHMLLGPSTMINYEGYSESIRILAATQDTLVNADIWTNGIVHVLDRKNKYKYQLSDSVTIVGSGIASGWFAKNAQLATFGIMQGYSALGAMGRYGPNWSNNAKNDIYAWENSAGNNFIGLIIRLPLHTSHDLTENSGPLSGPGASNARGPAIENAILGLGPWRHINYRTNDNSWDWFGGEGSGNLFVAVAFSGTNRVITSSDGITWTPRSVEASNWMSVTYGNNLFVAVASDGTNRVMTSPDGITWTARSVEASNWRSVTYGNNLFVAVAGDGTNRVMTSPDGTTWTARSAAENNPWWSVTYGNGLFVAVASDGTNRVMTSPDGIIWTARSAAEANEWYGITYNNNLFVAVAGDGTNRVMTSPDGINWTPRSVEASSWMSVTYGNNLFVAVASFDTNRVMTSPDGITWTARSVETSNWRSVTYSNNLFVAVAWGGTNRVITSPDGITWTARLVEASSWWSVITGQVSFSYKGIFRYIYKYAATNEVMFAYNTNVSTPLSIDLSTENTWAGLMLGFEHPGGQFKDYAQCLFSMINGLSNEVNSNANIMSNAIFSQLLVSSYEDAQDMSYAKLVGGTYYRLGITWKGTLRPDNLINTYGSEVFTKFQWGPVALVGDENQYSNAMITTDSLLSPITRSQNTYRTDMVSGWVGAIDTDDLDTWDNLRIDIILRPKSPKTWAAGRCYRGAEIMLFVDNIFLEHEGDIVGASGNGYVEIDHYPESGTLTVDRFKPTKPAVVTLANGTRQTIDSTGTGERFLHKIEADFSRVSQTVYEQFEQLLRWQDMGYKIALHPFLPKVPFCLIGEFELRNISKSFWDLTKFSFRFSFVETE